MRNTAPLFPPDYTQADANPARVSGSRQENDAAAAGADVVPRAEVTGFLTDGDRVTGVLQLKCYVACTPEFDGISRVADHASKVFMTAFGDDGRHPRSVLGMMRLPQNAPVMIDLIARLKRKDRSD
ncbi:MAG: RidA family protein [Alphaproteobacteria bacterium]|nr:RidA family protein [Alphaproteobacteria bacterium]